MDVLKMANGKFVGIVVVLDCVAPFTTVTAVDVELNPDSWIKSPIYECLKKFNARNVFIWSHGAPVSCICEAVATEVHEEGFFLHFDS